MKRSAGTLTTGILLLVAFFVQGIFFIRANSQTDDEANHLAAGYSYLTTGDFRLNSEHPPLIKSYSIFVYDLTDNEDALRKLAETYVKSGIALPSQLTRIPFEGRSG